MTKFFFNTFTFSVLLFSCSAPGVQAPASSYGFSGEKYYFDESDKLLNVKKINYQNINQYNLKNENYLIAPGDKLNIIVWGIPEVFPMANVNSPNSPLNTRTVDSTGEIFFPYVGKVSVENKSIEEARELITNGLGLTFIDPQVDVTIIDFNEGRNAYIVGEVLVPVTFKVGIEDITLMDAIGMSKGLDPKTSKPNEIYVMRDLDGDPIIFKFDLSTSDKFLLANQFVIKQNDVIYVGPSDITNWNRVVAQLFPFSSFLNQLDLIANRN